MGKSGNLAVGMCHHVVVGERVWLVGGSVGGWVGVAWATVTLVLLEVLR
jgi:hypothetical protein